LDTIQSFEKNAEAGVIYETGSSPQVGCNLPPLRVIIGS